VGPNAYNILVRKPDRRRHIGRPGCICEDNIKMDLREIAWESFGLDSSG
jgi:hypothetical protein